MTAARLSPARALQHLAQFHAKGPGSRSRSHRSGRFEGPHFKPGDPVKETGIYEVLHDDGHRTVHEAVMLASDLFPACDTCFEKVRFRLVRTAPYIFEDADFES